MGNSFWWEKNPKPMLGVTCRSLEDIIAYAKMPEFDILELKVANLAKKGFPLYTIDERGHYSVHYDNAIILSKILRGKPYQVHMPFEGDNLALNERNLYHSCLEDHDELIDRQRAISSLFKSTGNKGICVWHPAAIMVKGKRLASDEHAVIKNANILYKKLDEAIYKEKWPIQMTLENQSAPKDNDIVLGYRPGDFWDLLKRTMRIGITVDTGHGNLVDRSIFSFRALIGSGVVCSVHFHSNDGKFDPKSFDDDQHVFATSKNMRGYKRWIGFFQREGIVVILELNKHYEYIEIQKYAQKLRPEIFNT